MTAEANDIPLRGVVGVLDRAASRELLRGRPLPPGLGGLELRADLLAGAEDAFEVLDRVPKGLPVLFTLRVREQGGAFEGDERTRPGIFRRALERGAAMVDVEWGSATARELSGERLPLVLSSHDFGRCELPGAETLRAMEALRPRAIKCVPTAGSLPDALRVLDWVAAGSREGAARVGFAMGERGLVSRVLSVSRGAPWTYGALGDAVAPGQPTAEELLELYRAGSLGRATRVLGVVGNPVAHSLSPHLHNPALERAGIDAVYIPFLLDSLEELSGAWERLGLRGLSVTVPFKEDAFRLADEVEPRARAAGAVNTLVLEREGDGGGSRAPRLHGYNTDLDGVLEPLRRRRDLGGVRVAVLGNGGAARGAVVALKEADASPTVIYRNVKRGLRVADQLGVPAFHLDDFAADSFDVIINATPVGLREGDPSPVPESAFRPGLIAFDMIYDPPLTAFLAAARRRGAETIDGGEMLIAQGLVQFRLFTQVEPDRRTFEESFARARAGRRPPNNSS